MRSRLTWLALTASALCVLALATTPVLSQPPDRSGYVGEWRLVPSVSSGRATIQSAFDRALRDVNSIMRAMARTQIDTNEMLVRRISIALDGPTVATTFHTTRAHRFRTRQNHPADVTTERGASARLTQLFRSGRLEMVFELEEGRRWTVLTVEENDRLRLTTTIDPTRLDHNVHYTLEFRRANRGPATH